jgi:hypothetical protein
VPWPWPYISPTPRCAGANPWSAALRNQRSASP